MAVTRFFLFPLLFRIIRRFGEESFGQISAALAFTTLISLVPLAALVLGLVSLFPEFSIFVDQLDKLLVDHLLPAGSGGLISRKILQFSARAAEVSGWGIAVLVVTAFMLVHTIERAFNHVWQVPEPRPMWQRLLLYVLVIAVWPLFVGALLAAISSALTASFGLFGGLRWVQAPLFKGLSLAALVLFFAFLYSVVPNATVRWKHALIAGLLAALGFLLLQGSFELYLKYFPSYRAIYGAFAVLPIFLIWVYLSWAVVLLGALVAATLPEFGEGRRKRQCRR